jgi:signal transduction histidine kinase
MAGDIELVEYYENPLLTKDGEERLVAFHNTVIRSPDGKIVRNLFSAEDITERKKSEEELQRSQEELRNLADHLQSVREQERTNIAREIHDDLGQTLTALKMDISWLRKKLPKDQETLLEKTKAMTKLTDMTIKTVKRISTELRPGLLDDLGLVAAIEWQAEEFQNRMGITCEVTVDPEEIILDRDRSTAIFRIFQETLTNIARHAKATRVTITLKEKDDKVELRVKDNGKGITEKQISHPKSFGLMGIRERVHPWEGQVKINGKPGEGTTVVVRIPIETG